MYSVLEDYRTEQKKVNGLNKNVPARISHSEYKDVLVNNKCLRHWINRIQNKYDKKGTYKINKML